MTTLSSLFAFSAVALALLLLVKMYETARDRRFFLLAALSRLDPSVGSCLSAVSGVCRTGKDSAVAFISDLPHRMESALGLFYRNIHQTYHSFLPNIRGVRHLRQDRDASAFLKDIRAEQERNGGGRIEDRLE